MIQNWENGAKLKILRILIMLFTYLKNIKVTIHHKLKEICNYINYI